MDNLIHQGAGIILTSEDAFSQIALSSYTAEGLKDEVAPYGLYV